MCISFLIVIEIQITAGSKILRFILLASMQNVIDDIIQFELMKINIKEYFAHPW